MSMEFYKQTFSKARKEHKCEFCGYVIPKGRKYSYESGKYDGDFFERKLCVTCADILSEFIKDTEDNEFQWDWVQEWLTDKHCCDCANRQSCEISSQKCDLVRTCYG